MLGADPASHLSTGVHQVGIFFPFDRTLVRYLSGDVCETWLNEKSLTVLKLSCLMLILYCLCTTPSNGCQLGKMIKGDWRLQCQSPWHHGPWETGWLFFLQQSISFFDFEFFCPSSNSGRIFQVYLCAETHNQDFLLDCAQLCSQNVFDDCAVQTSTWWLPFLISVSLCVKRLTQSS